MGFGITLTPTWGCRGVGSLGGMTSSALEKENADLGILLLPSCLSRISEIFSTFSTFYSVSFPFLSAPFYSVNSDVHAL